MNLFYISLKTSFYKNSLCKTTTAPKLLTMGGYILHFLELGTQVKVYHLKKKSKIENDFSESIENKRQVLFNKKKEHIIL